MAAVALVVAPAADAFAKDFDLTNAEIVVELQSDGSVLVTEHITFDFDGSFSGGFRDIPLRAGETIADIAVSEGPVSYALGGCTQLGCRDRAATYGTADLDDAARIVWHYAAFDEARTFTIVYRLVGLAVAYDDIVDVNLKVWGDEWREGLASLQVAFGYPGAAQQGEVRVWGFPGSVDGATSLGADGTTPTLRASEIPAGQFVEMRVIVPRSSLTATDSARVVAGNGLEEVLDDVASTTR